MEGEGTTMRRISGNRRKRAALVTVFCLASALHAVEFAGGTGRPYDPYQIATAEQLISIGSDPNLLDKHFVLLNDIDLDPNLPGGAVFVRAVIGADTDDNFGFQGAAFTGYFDGNDHRIKNLTIQCALGYYVGLFGCIGDDGFIQDLVLENILITGAHYVVGGLAGINRGDIRSCRVDGSLHVGTRPYIESLGGMVGVNTGKILWSCAETNTHGDGKSRSLGGLVGTNWEGRIVGCHAEGSLTGGDSLGGLVGNNVEGIILDCYVEGSVLTEVSSPGSGGLVGYNQAGVIVNCYAATILRKGIDRWDWGGLVGYGAPRVLAGGIVGSAVANSFWDTEASGASVSHGGTGLSTLQMYQQKTFVGWDFDYTWSICEGKDYPRLRWEAIDCNGL